MKRTVLWITLVVLLCSLALPATAQDPTKPLSYGQTFTGTISNREFEVLYTFTGSAGDIILAIMETPSESELHSPALLLLDSNAEALASQSGWRQALLAYTLPAADTYTLIATRENGRAGDGQGDFQIRLLLPTVLTAGSPISDTVSDPTLSDYFFIQTETNVRLDYARTSGVYAPRIHVGLVHQDNWPGHVEDWGAIDIPIQLGGSILLPAEEPTLYLIEVSTSPRLSWDTSLPTETRYTLAIEQAE